MAYDEDLAQRIRELLVETDDVTEKRMFGGLAFLVGGNMAVAAGSKGGLLVRVDPAQAGSLLERTSVQPMEMRGRAMRGWLQVDAASVEEPRELARWVELGRARAAGLPRKPSARS